MLWLVHIFTISFSHIWEEHASWTHSGMCCFGLNLTLVGLLERGKKGGGKEEAYAPSIST